MLTIMTLLAACRSDVPRPAHGGETILAVARAPVGLVGDWIAVAPGAVRGDTLRLRADSSATGLIPWSDGRFARVSRWEVRFGSKDPAIERGDWRQGHPDGGDIECHSRERATECRSMPMLCLRTATRTKCEMFALRAPDSLALSSGLRFVRALTLREATRK